MPRGGFCQRNYFAIIHHQISIIMSNSDNITAGGNAATIPALHQEAQAAPAKPAKKNVSDILNSPSVKSKMQQVLGSEKAASGFVSSVISVVSNSKLLANADPMTVVGAAMVAATLQLPIVPTIGLAYIVPYKGQAQFQISYKGLIELAERSGQFKNIIDEVVYEGQLIKRNRFTGEYIFDEDAKKSDTIIGYMARFDLINGFSKTIYWTKEEVVAHATKFSEAFKKGYMSPWKSDFDAMARKTVLKALFSKYAPKSIQTQGIAQAISYDQSVVTASDDSIDIEAFEVSYPDNAAAETLTPDSITNANGSEASALASAAFAKAKQQ